MATTPFKPVNWTPNELISKESMNQMANNVQWLKDNKVEGMYTLEGGTKRDQGIKVCAGRTIITPHPKTNQVTKRVHFPNFFSNRCQPIITTGVVSNWARTFAVVRGLNSLLPDDNGFEIEVTKFSTGKKQPTITKSFYVNWIATGY